MARPSGGMPLQQKAGFAPQSYDGRFPPQMVPLIAARVNGGVNTVIDAADIDPSQLFDALNTRIRFDKTTRRRGTNVFGASIPDTNEVMALYNFKDSQGISTLVRFTPTTLYRNPDAWLQITGTLTGTNANRYNIVTAFTQIVFSNDGIDPIQIIDLSTNTFAQLGNAPRYKFITVFANRVVGAYFNEIGSENPIQIGWSGDADITEWDPNVDISAGFSSVIDSPGDNSDFITGVFGFTNVIVLLRERSLWVGTKNPIATDPFSFYADVPGIGCGCPYSAAVIPGGLCFADHRTQKIYAYTPGSQPIAISTNVELGLFAAIQNPLTVFGSYDNRNNEYSLAIPLVATNIVRVWTFNFRTQAWAYDERVNLSCISDIEGAAQELTIDQLVGTIDNLIGTIDDLVGTVSSATSRLYGYNDGSLQLERPSADTDAGLTYNCRLISKTFNLSNDDQYVCQVATEYFCRASSTITLSFSKDGGQTWNVARTDTITKVNQPVLLTYNHQIKCRKFIFKLESSIGDWDLLNYGLNVFRSGPSRATAP
jgi:hypothetical protein